MKLLSFVNRFLCLFLYNGEGFAPSIIFSCALHCCVSLFWREIITSFCLDSGLLMNSMSHPSSERFLPNLNMRFMMENHNSYAPTISQGFLPQFRFPHFRGCNQREILGRKINRRSFEVLASDSCNYVTKACDGNKEAPNGGVLSLNGSEEKMPGAKKGSFAPFYCHNHFFSPLLLPR